MNKPLIIVGAGGHAKVVLDAALCSGQTVIGLADINTSRHGDYIFNVPIIDGGSWMKYHAVDTVSLVIGIGSVGDTSKREAVFDQMCNMGYEFTTVIHPSAVIARDATLGRGVVIMAGAIVQSGCHIEDNVIINTGAQVDHDCHIFAHAHIASGAILSGNVVVGRGSHIGTGAKFIQGIKIGEKSIVAAGAVVIRDAPKCSMLKGVPAKALI